MQLICAFVFAYAKSRFSHDIATIVIVLQRISSDDESGQENKKVKVSEQLEKTWAPATECGMANGFMI